MCTHQHPRATENASKTLKGCSIQIWSESFSFFFSLFCFILFIKSLLMQTTWNKCKYYEFFINMYTIARVAINRSIMIASLNGIQESADSGKKTVFFLLFITHFAIRTASTWMHCLINCLFIRSKAQTLERDDGIYWILCCLHIYLACFMAIYFNS